MDDRINKLSTILRYLKNLREVMGMRQKKTDSWAEDIIAEKFKAYRIDEKGNIIIEVNDETKKLIEKLHHNNMVVGYHRSMLEHYFEEGSKIWCKIFRQMQEEIGEMQMASISFNKRVDVDFVSNTIILRPRDKEGK